MAAFLKIPKPLVSAVPTTEQDLLSLLQKHSGGRCNVLQHCLNYLLSSEERGDFIRKILPVIFSTANRSTELFPHLQVPRILHGESHLLKFSRLQAACILSHMFLCTFTDDCGSIKSGKKIGDTVVEAEFHSFSPWFSAEPFKRDFDEPDVRSDDPRLAYCRSIIQYFVLFSQMTDKQLMEHVTFSRVKSHSEQNWANCQVVIHKSVATVCLVGQIGGKLGLEVEFDFANEEIGPGPLATQEEICFGMSPESCIAALVCDVMQPDESILITGIMKVCKSKGYGLSLLAEPLSPQELHSFNPNKRVIMCLDAMDMSSVPDTDDNGTSLAYQLQPALLKRELTKLLAGFGATPPEMPIGTGKWGCGVFRGHPGLKSLLQIMVAAAVGRHLVFYVFGDRQLNDVIDRLLALYDAKPVSQVWTDLTATNGSGHAKLLEVLSSYR